MDRQDNIDIKSTCKWLTFIRGNTNYMAAISYLNNLKKSNTFVHFLSSDEQDQYQKIPSKIRQDTFLSGRICAKQAVAMIGNINNLSEIQIAKGIFEFPIIIHKDIRNAAVSIAHTNKATVAIAFPEAHPIGVDIEEICDEKSEIIETQLSGFEKNLRSSLAISNVLSNVIIWTAKESLSKVLKTGLTASQIVYEVKSLSSNPAGFYEVQYKHFFQYRAISYIVNNHVLTFCIPKNSELQEYNLSEALK